MTDPELYCEHCGRKLREGQEVYLELSFKTNRWYSAGECPPAESQGCFPVGRTCAERLLHDA